MNSTQVKLVQESFAKVVPISEAAAVIFYDRLFEVAPVGEGDVSGRHDASSARS